jgi:hypothetical protein
MKLTKEEIKFVQEWAFTSAGRQAERDKAAIAGADKNIAAKKQGFTDSAQQDSFNKAKAGTGVGGVSNAGRAVAMEKQRQDKLAAMKARDNSLGSRTSRAIQSHVPTAAQGVARSALNGVTNAANTVTGAVSPKLSQARNFIKAKTGY